MDKISVRNLVYNGSAGQMIINTELQEFSFDFHFGKSYLLHSQATNGSWAVSWIIGGALDADSGTVKLNTNNLSTEQRKHILWFVTYSEIKRFGFFHQSVRPQIQAGLRKYDNTISEEEIASHFHLIPANFSQKLTQMRGEIWRASMAIGFVHQKKIYCFPHVGFLYEDSHDLFRIYGHLLDDIIKRLTNAGALVLIPTHRLEPSSKYIDEVVAIE